MLHLGDVPLILVLCHLPVRDLYKCTLACNTFYALAKKSVWRALFFNLQFFQFATYQHALHKNVAQLLKLPEASNYFTSKYSQKPWQILMRGAAQCPMPRSMNIKVILFCIDLFF